MVLLVTLHCMKLLRAKSLTKILILLSSDTDAFRLWLLEMSLVVSFLKYYSTCEEMTKQNI